jgi:Ca2+/H+ antiporter
VRLGLYLAAISTLRRSPIRQRRRRNMGSQSGTDASVIAPALPTAATSQFQPYYFLSLYDEFMTSASEYIFPKTSRITYLFLLGPLALFGDSTGVFPSSFCFACAGCTLIPLAERLSFITEQVAKHTNGTIGALLNATFGNAPELLISTAALRSGYYRIVQLVMLGSILTNMLLVFGCSCLIGGLQYQVQSLRTTSGNVNVVMLLVGVAGSLLPAALVLTGQLSHRDSTVNYDLYVDNPTPEEVVFCRVNAVVMLALYVLYLVFQLGTHKNEFDDSVERKNINSSRRNLFCLRLYNHVATTTGLASAVSTRSADAAASRPLKKRNSQLVLKRGKKSPTATSATSPPASPSRSRNQLGQGRHHTAAALDHLRFPAESDHFVEEMDDEYASLTGASPLRKPPLATSGVSFAADPEDIGETHDVEMNGHSDHDDHSRHEADDEDHANFLHHHHSNHQEGHSGRDDEDEPLISLQVGILWLFVITVCISAMTEILVNTIDDFAQKMHLSEVFTSMVIVPFFSNVAEQASAFIFAYRNEMDLVVGVTVGSAIQIATFVLPGSVLIGFLLDRSMTLFFRGFETVCLLFATLVVASVLQGGTTNWLVGAMLIGIYVMIATGIWVHELEDLTTDIEVQIHNITGALNGN